MLAQVLGMFRVGENALEWAGVWICPLLGALLTLIVAIWVWRSWSWPVAVLFMLVFLINPFTRWTFALGRPDHQCLIFPCLMTAILLLIDKEPSPSIRFKALVGSAALTAAGVWISVQSLGVWALLCGVLVLQAATAPPRDRAAPLKDALKWSTAAALFGLLFLILEGRRPLFALVADSISIGHVVLMAGPAIGLFIGWSLLRYRQSLRGAAWFVLAAAPPSLLAFAAVFWLWTVQSSAYGAETLEAMGLWFADNSEFQPALFFVDGRIGLGRLHSCLAYTFYLLPFLLFSLWRTRALGMRGKWILGAGLLIGSMLTLWEMRWRDLHALFIAPVFALSLWHWLGRLRPLSLLNMPVRFALSLLIAGLLLFPWLQTTVLSIKAEHSPPSKYVALRRISDWIKTHDPCQPGEKNPAILARWDEGPMVKYWSGRPVIAGPYHRNIEGIQDTMRAFTARSEQAFKRLAVDRRLRYLVRPPQGDPNHDLYSFEQIVACKRPALYIRTRQLARDGARIIRGYDLGPGMIPDSVEKILRYRLESNRWDGWSVLHAIEVPGLEHILGDAEAIPYLYRVEISP